jgi:hypothetical protein
MSQFFVNINASGTGFIQTITGNDGVATAPIGNNIFLRTANTTVEFLNTGGSQETLDFAAPANNGNLLFGCFPAFGNAVTGTGNIGLGINALLQIFSGNRNIGIGTQALGDMETGSLNVAVGYLSGNQLVTGSFNTSLGSDTLQTDGGSYNTVVGYNAGSQYTSTESSNINIGNVGVTGESNVMRLGTQGSGNGQVNTAYMAGIVGNTVANTELVTINSSTGQLGVTSTLSPALGGTGVDNASGSTITLGGALTTSGAHALTLTTTGSTNVTLPTTGTLATTSQLATAGVLQSLNFSMTNAQIKAGNAVTLVAAQGSGIVIVPVAITLKLVYGGSNAFTSAPTIFIQYGITIGSNDSWQISTTTTFFEATSNFYITTPPLVKNQIAYTSIENTALTIGFTAVTGNAAGDNTITGNLLYYLITI